MWFKGGRGEWIKETDRGEATSLLVGEWIPRVLRDAMFPNGCPPIDAPLVVADCMADKATFDLPDAPYSGACVHIWQIEYVK